MAVVKSVPGGWFGIALAASFIPYFLPSDIRPDGWK